MASSIGDSSGGFAGERLDSSSVPVPGDGTARIGRRRLLTDAAGVGAALLLVTGAATLAAKPAAAVSSSGFRWCSRCQSMWFADGGNNGHCPVEHWWDHSHYQNDSPHYVFVDAAGALDNERFGQAWLKWCLTCKAAYFNLGPGVCPNNSAGHTPSPTTYLLESDVSTTSDFPKHPGWNRCTRCHGLYYGPNWIDTHCPDGGRTHQGAATETPAGWHFEDYRPRLS